MTNENRKPVYRFNFYDAENKQIASSVGLTEKEATSKISFLPKGYTVKKSETPNHWEKPVECPACKMEMAHDTNAIRIYQKFYCLECGTTVEITSETYRRYQE